MGKTGKYKNAVRVNCIETSESDDPLKNYVHSGYCIIFLKDNVLYNVSGYDEEPFGETAEMTA